MAGPWEQYQSVPAEDIGPWSGYQTMPAVALEEPPANEIPGPRRQIPAWAKDYPGLYETAQGARQLLGPTIEAGSAVSGAALGSLGGPAGTVMGSAAGYGLAKGALRQADVLLGFFLLRTLRCTSMH